MRLSLLNLFFFGFILLAEANHTPSDSVGFEKKNGKIYVLHKVEPKETLYSISRKYQAQVNDIKLANPDVNGGISIGQTIKVPYQGKNISTKPSEPKPSSSSSNIHTVEAKETLYSISKKYKLSVDELIAANPELKNGLKTGQQLLIPSKDLAKNNLAKPENETKKIESKKENDKEETPVIEENVEEQEVEASVKKTKTALSAPPSSAYKKINESGYAEVMPNPSDELKYLALHKTAPIGTIIQVRNDDNDQKIFVRVIGKITNNNDKALLKLSPKALERLGAKTDKVQVSISYIP